MVLQDSGPAARRRLACRTRTKPRAQQRLYELRAEPFRRLSGWVERYRQIWDARFEDLDRLIEELKRKEKTDGRKKRR